MITFKKSNLKWLVLSLFSLVSTTSLCQKYILEGKWYGVITQYNGTVTYKTEFDFKQKSNKIYGTAKHSGTINGIASYVIYNIDGEVDFDNNQLFLYDRSIKTEFGTHSFCKKNYVGEILIENDSIRGITGNWENDGKNIFENKVLTQNYEGCVPGTFEIRTPEQQKYYERQQQLIAAENLRKER